MSLIRRCDEYLFHDPDDRITLCDDNRAYVRLPARALRSTGRNAWLIATCSWTNVLCPITLFAVMLDPSNLSLSASFWLNYTALISLVGLFRYASEVLSVEAPAPVKKIWNATLGSFSPDVEVAFIALCKGYYMPVKIYITGKISTTLLLTLGLCFLTSGSLRSSDHWNTSLNYTMNSLLIGSIIPYVLIATFESLYQTRKGNRPATVLSLGISLFLLALYVLYHFFRKTHSARFEHTARIETPPRVMRKISSVVAIALMALTIFATRVCSLPMLNTIATASDHSANDEYVPTIEIFGFCLLPCLAELPELIKICSLAFQGEMDISFEVATATGLHTMLLVGPCFCLFTWCMGSVMDLNLGGFNSVVLLLNVWVSSLINRYGESNYLHGVAFYMLYAVEVLAFYMCPPDLYTDPSR